MDWLCYVCGHDEQDKEANEDEFMNELMNEIVEQVVRLKVLLMTRKYIIYSQYLKLLYT